MPQRLKILIFIDWYLPGYKAGGPIQSIANLVSHLKDEFDFSIITRDTDYCETQAYKEVKSNEWNVLRDGTRVYYISSDQLTRSTIRQLIRKENFDVAYLNGIYSLYFTLFPLFYLRKKHESRIVIAARGMFAESALGVKKTKKRFFLRAVKVLNLFGKVLFHATNENEMQEIKTTLGNNTKIKIAKNLPQKSTSDKMPERIKTKDFVRLINVARIAPEKNLLIALLVLKQVKWNVEFDIYGPIYNEDYWKECKEVIKSIPSNIQVNYMGSIESDRVLEQLQNYHFMFMPTRGENFGHIILQSLSVGCPVIISDQTPWQQLKEKNVGWDISLNTMDTFAKTIDFCAQMEQVDYDKMLKASFEYAQQYIQNPEIIEQNRQLFL